MLEGVTFRRKVRGIAYNASIFVKSETTTVKDPG